MPALRAIGSNDCAENSGGYDVDFAIAIAPLVSNWNFSECDDDRRITSILRSERYDLKAMGISMTLSHANHVDQIGWIVTWGKSPFLNRSGRKGSFRIWNSRFRGARVSRWLGVEVGEATCVFRPDQARHIVIGFPIAPRRWVSTGSHLRRIFTIDACWVLEEIWSWALELAMRLFLRSLIPINRPAVRFYRVSHLFRQRYRLFRMWRPDLPRATRIPRFCRRIHPCFKFKSRRRPITI